MYGHTRSNQETHVPQIFVAFSHRDEKLRAQLDKHLTVLQRTRGVESWNDRQIGPGDEWQGVINDKLTSADLIVLLVSPDFIASDYCWDVELSHALRRHQAGEALICPVILRPISSWQKTPIGQFQVLPADGKPVTKWKNRDEAFAAIVDGIEAMLSQWRFGEVQASILEPRVTWVLRVRGKAADFDKRACYRITRTLRKITRDSTLDFLKKGTGSVELSFRSSEACMKSVMRLHREGSLSKSLTEGVIGVTKEVGASLHVSVQEAGPSSSLLGAPASLPVGDTVNGGFPPLVGGMVIPLANPLQPGFNLLVDGSQAPPTAQEQAELTILLRDYLNAALVVLPDQLKVDLSPFDEYCGIPDALRRTRLGHDLLEQDVVLKDYTARLLHPSLDGGGRFWSELEKTRRADEGLSAWFRVWITPDNPSVKETGHEDRAEISIGRIGFKVQCEPDYKAFEYLRESGRSAEIAGPETNQRAVEVFKSHILPLVHREVCLGNRFGRLRQILTVIIMSAWVRQSSLAEPFRKAGFLDSNDTARFKLDSVKQQPTELKKYYLRMLNAGVWQCSRNSYDPVAQKIVNRVYMAGGIEQ